MKIPTWTLLLVPIFLIYLGITLNVTVLAANDSQMPVLWPGGCQNYPIHDGDQTHVCLTKDSHLRILCDWIIVGTHAESPGDVLQDLGDALQYPFAAAWLALALNDKGWFKK